MVSNTDKFRRKKFKPEEETINLKKRLEIK